MGCERLSPPTLYGLVIIIHFIWRLYRDQDLAIKQAGVSRPWFACVFLSLIICYVSLLIFVVFVLGDCNIWERDYLIGEQGTDLIPFCTGVPFWNAFMFLDVVHSIGDSSYSAMLM